jgi:hypothetical protein
VVSRNLPTFSHDSIIHPEHLFREMLDEDEWERGGWRVMSKGAGRIMTVHTLVTGVVLICLISSAAESAAAGLRCVPTPWDEIGPFYRPKAPVRSVIGSGYVLSGTVRSAMDCAPVVNARIEVWQAGVTGTYDDSLRATLFSDWRGRYRLETVVPSPYGSRPSHIHILVDAKGFEGLITQHYPKQGERSATMDLVLAPETPQGGEGRNPMGR